MPRKSLNKQQFGDIPMFLTATELKTYLTDSLDRLPDEDIDELWDRKRQEAQHEYHEYMHGSGVYDSIARDGFNWNFPVEVLHHGKLEPGKYEKLMGEGHHRVAAAAEIEEDTGKPIWIPIDHQFT